jgi:hypothetical protein
VLVPPVPSLDGEGTSGHAQRTWFCSEARPTWVADRMIKANFQLEAHRPDDILQVS